MGDSETNWSQAADLNLFFMSKVDLLILWPARTDPEGRFPPSEGRSTLSPSIPSEAVGVAH